MNEADEHLRAEVATAIAGLTQIIANRDITTSAPERIALHDGSQVTRWAETPDAEVLTDDDPSSVLIRGGLLHTYCLPGDFYSMKPVDAIALGKALVAAGSALVAGIVVALPIGGRPPT